MRNEEDGTAKPAKEGGGINQLKTKDFKNE